MKSLQHKDAGTAYAKLDRLLRMSGALVFAIIFVFLIFDSVPRFYQGDSLSYITTDYHLKEWIPPDRSWIFGALSNFLLRATHGYLAYIYLNSFLLFILIIASKQYFADGRTSQTIAALVLCLLAADPLVEVYTRFIMSDFPASVGFLGSLLLLSFAVREETPRRKAIIAAVGSALLLLVAILMRVAYALMMELAVLAWLALRRLRTRDLRRTPWSIALITLVTPFLSIALLVSANSVVFKDRFPSQVFVMKSSGIFMAGIFSPALSQRDFEAARIPISPAEFAALKLNDYDKRNAQVWGQSNDDLQQFIKNKLNIKDDYTPLIDQKGSELIKSALMRNPIKFAGVYMHILGLYLSARQWRSGMDQEMGTDRSLPQAFVDYSNQYTYLKIYPGITALKSILVKMALVRSYFYSLQMVLGVLSALYLLLVAKVQPGVVLLAAAFMAIVLTIPLHSAYVIPRYELSAVFSSYLLIGLAIETLLARRRGTSASGGLTAGKPSN